MYITTERIGQHKFLLSIIYDHYDFREKKTLLSLFEKISMVEALSDYNSKE